MMRWTEGGDDSPAARRAADLLRKLPAPAALTARQLADLEARLQQPAPRRARLLPRLTLAFGATAAIAAIIVLVTLRTTPARRVPSAQRTIVLPQCGDVALDLTDHAVTLTGPGTAAVERDHIILGAGRLHIAASPRTLTITAPDAQITLPPGSSADIRVHDARTIVAALTGHIAVQWTATRTLAQLSPGTSVSDSGPATLPPAHCEATPSAAPSPAPSPAGVGPSPTVVPEPLPAPTLAAPARRSPPPAPVRAPVPSASPSPAAAVPAESALGAEARLLATALLRLRAHDPAGALSILDDYDARFPRGQLAVEASRLRATVRSLPAASPRDE